MPAKRRKRARVRRPSRSKAAQLLEEQRINETLHPMKGKGSLVKVFR